MPAKYTNATRPCLHCQAPFLPPHLQSRRKFCSRRCSALHQPRPDPAACFWSGVARAGRRPHECWLWTRNPSRRYGAFKVRGRQIAAHCYAYTLTHGPIPPGRYVCHTCDTPRCCNPAHLVLGTSADNSADMWAKGRGAHGDRSGARRHPETLARGERNANARLTEAKVRAIRAAYEPGRGPELATLYGVGENTILRVINGESWKHVK